MLHVLLALVALSAPAATGAAPQAPPSFGACDRLAAREPESEETASCYDQAGAALQQTDAAKAKLQELLRRHPGSPWPWFYLAYRNPSAGEDLARIADSFAARKDAKGEVTARVNLYRLLFNARRLDEANKQVESTVRAAQASGDPELIARARVLKARYLWGMGQDLEGAYVLLRQAEPALFPNGVYALQRECLLALANVDLELGRYQEGFEAFQRLTDLAETQKDLYTEANARCGMARAALDRTGELPSEEGRQEAIRLAQRALGSATQAQAGATLAEIHLMLGMLTKGEVARSHFEACLSTATTPRDQSVCLYGLARWLSRTDPQAAQRTIDRSLELARQAQDPWSTAFAWRERMRVSWAAGAGDRAVEDSRAALDVIEALRDQQAGSSGQAQAFSTWSEDYYWLSGRLITAAQQEGRPEDLDRAFQVSERLRARSLIDTLEAAHALPAAAIPVRQQRGAALERISTVQRRLLDPALPAAAREAATKELERLEVEEADLRNQLARAAPALSRRPGFATLARVRQALAADEALLSFQVSSWEDERGDFAGGSWLLVTTRGGTRVYRLPARGDLRPAVRLFNGTFDQRDGSDALPAAGLYRRLLEAPLRELPPGVRRLILVPDDALHQLPFAALRPGPKEPPLAARYELTEVPSATLWLSWKERRPAAAPIPALALADPPLPGGDGVRFAAAKERAAVAVFASGIRLGPLPYARTESRAVVRDLGGGSVQRLGADASEVYLKTTPLKQFGVLHFATHAVTDEANPDRSGVLLAPGAANQDGLLQIREIVDLDLQGRVIVLSACSSNTGAMLRGEGVMSLARAFFQAGAHTVVASLWRLRDDEAADFFDRFYRHLGKGRSVAAALQAAQRDMIKEGAPAAAWAGLVVLGDGDLVPLPGGRKGWYVPLWAWLAGGAVILGILGLFAARRSRRSVGSV
jgi:CHAT domain-containing protein/tetratricopeptide (TPR) repeat protein